jgi:GNAT superfamily N-acetyltransferase
VVQAHGETYAKEFGWGPAFEALVARIVADFADAPAAEGQWQGRAGWIADLAGRRVGCVLCVPSGVPDVAQLRLLLVDPVARGHGLGGRLVDACLEFARTSGCRAVRLWTNHPLVAARAVYLARGFRLVGEDAEPHRTFGVPLVGQAYELDLRTPSPS